MRACAKLRCSCGTSNPQLLPQCTAAARDRLRFEASGQRCARKHVRPCRPLHLPRPPTTRAPETSAMSPGCLCRCTRSASWRTPAGNRSVTSTPGLSPPPRRQAPRCCCAQPPTPAACCRTHRAGAPRLGPEPPPGHAPPLLPAGLQAHNEHQATVNSAPEVLLCCSNRSKVCNQVRHSSQAPQLTHLLHAGCRASPAGPPAPSPGCGCWPGSRRRCPRRSGWRHCLHTGRHCRCQRVSLNAGQMHAQVFPVGGQGQPHCGAHERLSSCACPTHRGACGS